MGPDPQHLSLNPRFDCPWCHKQVSYGQSQTLKQGWSQHFRMIHTLPSREAVAFAHQWAKRPLVKPPRT